jgi:hypothetical protein
MEQIESAETAENMDEDTAAPSETVLAAWPTPNTPNGGRSSPSMSATGVMPDGTKRQAGLEHVARLVGWPTPDCSDSNTRPNGKGGKTMMDVAMLCGWATPRAEDAESAGMRHSRGVADTLTAQAGQGVPLAGWQTPTVEDAGRDGSLKDYMNYVENGQTSGCRLRAQVHATGHAIPSSPAATEKRGALNANMSRWLMGLPLSWTLCGMLAFLKTRSNRRSAPSRSSSTGSGA